MRAALANAVPKMTAAIGTAVPSARIPTAQPEAAPKLHWSMPISAEAARTKKIVSPVAGQADILLVPDLEAGNMLAKQLAYLSGAEGAGIVLGARVPIVLTSRADSVLTRLASCAVASLVADARRTSVGAAIR